jgi:hypothetical protein
MTSTPARVLLLTIGFCAQLYCASALPAGRVGPSAQLSVSGAVLRPGSYDLAALKALPAISQTVAGKVYTGVGLWNFLNNVVGLKGDVTAKHASLAMYVVATGSDGYRVVISLSGAGLAANGFARIVVPNDVKGGRYVTNLVSLDVFLAPASP